MNAQQFPAFPAILRRQKDIDWSSSGSAPPGWTWRTGALVCLENEAVRVVATGHGVYVRWESEGGPVRTYRVALWGRRPPGLLEIPKPVTAEEAVVTVATALQWGTPMLPVGFRLLWTDGWDQNATCSWVPPRALSDRAVCRNAFRRHAAPAADCECGFHAAYSPWELCWWTQEYVCGLLVVTPVGKCLLHANAWRASRYQTHAVVVGLNWEPPAGWVSDVPILRAELPDIPLRAWEIAQEIVAQEALEAAGV